MKKLVRFLMLAILALFTTSATPTQAHADDSATTKVENAASDAKANTKHDVRKVRRKVRKATGNDNIVKDAKDGVNDAGDSMENAAEKAKNRKKNN